MSKKKDELVKVNPETGVALTEKDPLGIGFPMVEQMETRQVIEKTEYGGVGTANDPKLLAKWKPQLEAEGIMDPYKQAWMSNMLETQAIEEAKQIAKGNIPHTGADQLRRMVREKDMADAKEVQQLKAKEKSVVDKVVGFFKGMFSNIDEQEWTAIDEDDKAFTLTYYDIDEYLKDIEVSDITVADISSMCTIESNKRSNKSDLDSPIFLAIRNGGSAGLIIDGEHRLRKAIDTDHKTIKAKILNLDTAPMLYQFIFA